MERVHDIEIVLASSSPRRADLLREAGYRFRVRPSEVEEPPYDHFLSAEAYAVHAAWLKARHVATFEKGWILGADTVVASGSRILGKARDRAHAEEILRTLMGTRHECITGVCLFLGGGGPAIVDSVATVVEMKRLAEGELHQFLDSGSWEGKAGAYGIQDKDDPLVRVVEGSWSNVVGLPLERLATIFELACRCERMDNR